MYPVAFDGILVIFVFKQDPKLLLVVCCAAPKRIPALKLNKSKECLGCF